jgi:hypothetical protein
MIGDAWDWFISSTSQPEFKRQNSQSSIGAHLTRKKSADTDSEIQAIQLQTGL